jgi:hypothetical protein
MRLALVHEFQTRSAVLVATEAGAKGLNLQFCETVINYDLPWNPQRIEQRIGRCHRYRQARDVTVVNFLARDNEAHRLTFDILSRKLDLFGKVLDASDTVLHEPRAQQTELVANAVSPEFVRDLSDIYARARTVEERTHQIAQLRDRIADRREAYEREYRRTSQIIESRFDQQVRQVFRRLQDELPPTLAQLDRDVAEIVDGYLADRGRTYTRSEGDGRIHFDLARSLPDELGGGRRFATGDARTLAEAEALNLAHPLVREALAAARAWSGGSVELDADGVGSEGVLTVVLVDYDGFERVQRLVCAAVIDGEIASPEVAARLARAPATDGRFRVEVDEALLAEALDEAMYEDQRQIEPAEQEHFARSVGQLERFVEDKILVLSRQRKVLADQIRAARKRRDEVVGSDVRARVEERLVALSDRDAALERTIRALHSREDEDYQRWRDHHHELRYRPPTVTPVARVAFRTRARS